MFRAGIMSFAENLLNLNLAPREKSNVLIVGGCGGVGQPLVNACLSLGHNVCVMALPSSIKRSPPPAKVLTIEMDATDTSSVGEAYSNLAAKWGGIDVLIYLVGFMMVPPKPIDDIAEHEWSEVILGNLSSAFFVCQGGLPMLRTAKGNIVIVSSSLSFNPLKGVSAYAAAKGGINSLTRSLAIENAPHIRANAIAPSAIETNFLAGGSGHRGEIAKSKGGDEWFVKSKGDYVPTIPMGRIAQPDDLIGACLFLSSASASFITGQTLHVNGGRITP